MKKIQRAINSFKNNARNTSSVMVADEVIHDELFSASEIIERESEEFVRQCNAMLTVEEIHTATSMKNFGFGNARNVKAVHSKISAAESAKKQIAVIKKYKESYPFYKFITGTCISQICEKYNLYLTEAGKFIGDIPPRNQQEILAFRVFEKDVSGISRISMTEMNRRMSSLSSFDSGSRFFDSGMEAAALQQAQRRAAAIEREYQQEIENEYDQWREQQKRESEAKATRKIAGTNLKIVAPLNQIEMTSQDTIRNRTIVTEDPIVLQPVHDGYLIVTVWGKEALDAMVQNDALN